MIGGKVMMDRNAPEGVTDTAAGVLRRHQGADRPLARAGRALYAVTPRFAITSTPAQLEMARALAAEHPDCYVQTHLSENHDEIAFTASLYPRRGTISTSTSATACSGRAACSATASTSPTASAGRWPRPGRWRSSARPRTSFSAAGSSTTPGSGGDGVRRAIATDVGGGTNYSMLRTLDEGYKVLALARAEARPAPRVLVDHPRERGGAGAGGPGRHADAGGGGGYRGARQRGDAGDGAADGDGAHAGGGALRARR